MSKGKNVPIQLNQCLRDFLPLKAVHAGGQEWAGISIVRARSACIFCNLSISHSLGYVFLVSSPRRLSHPPDPPQSLVNLTPKMWNTRAQSVCFPARCPHNTDTPRLRLCSGGRHRRDSDTEHRGECHRERISCAWGLLLRASTPTEVRCAQTQPAQQNVRRDHRTTQ